MPNATLSARSLPCYSCAHGWHRHDLAADEGALTLPPLESVRFVELGFEEPTVPEWLRGLPNLTGLLVHQAESLPEWLAELPKLEVLILAHPQALATAPEKFTVVEKMTNLRVLVLAPKGGDRVPFDFSALRKLEYLSVSMNNAKGPDDFVRGFEHVGRCFFYMPWGEATAGHFMHQHPNVRDDGNVFRMWPGLRLYRWMLGPGDPQHWLARLAASTQWPTPPQFW